MITPRSIFVPSAVVLLAVVSTVHVGAQTTAAGPDTPGASLSRKESPIRLEPFTVTGTNAKRLDVENSLPVSVIGRELIDGRNALTPVELLTALPQVTNVPLNESSAGGANARGDNANINLRGIGSGNTLVLLNGRRVAPHPVTSPDGGALSFSVNVNQLPTQGIARIDVLRDGASSVYGSDAVAGVINYVTRRDFRGTEVRTRLGVPEHGGGETWQTTLMHGREFARGQGRLLAIIDCLIRQPLPLSERSFSRSADHTTQAPAPFNVAGSSFDGRATVGLWPAFRVGASTASTYFRPVNGTPTLTSVAPTRAANPEFYLNINEYQNLGQTRSHRQNWYNSLEYDLTERLSAFADLSYYHARTNLVRQPVPFNAPAADLLAPLAMDNPFNPYGTRFYSPTGAANADGTPRLTGTPQAVTLVSVTLRDAGPEDIVVNSGVFRAVAGLRGRLGTDWEWEAGALHTQAGTSDIARNGVRESLLQQALQRTDTTAFNPFNYTFRVQGGAVVADQPYTNPTAVMETVVQPWRRDGFSAITSGDLRVAGPLWRYWGNTVALAVGVEHRLEQFEDRRAPFAGVNPVGSGLVAEGNDFIQASPKPDSAGERTVTSGYAEVAIPVVGPAKRVPLLHALEFSAAARYEHYSDFGTKTSPKVGANWKLCGGLMLRLSRNEGFAAANLPTLYAPTQYTVDTAPGQIDPYRNQAINDPAYVQRGYSAGNRNLLPIESKGESAGLVLEIPRLKGLSLTADYWKIEQKNEVGSRVAPQILDSDNALLRASTQAQLAAGRTLAQIDLGSGTVNYRGDPAIVREPVSAADRAAFDAANAGKPLSQQVAPVGRIISRSAAYENLAEGYASGVDFGLIYLVPALPLGRLSLHTEWSYLIKTYQRRTPAGAAPSRVERMDVAGTTRWRGTATATWRRGAWAGTLGAYYIGSWGDPNATITAAQYAALGAPGYIAKSFDSGTDVFRYRVHDVATCNFTLAYRCSRESAKWLRATTLRLGVINLADRAPPLAQGAFGYSATVHGALLAGRTWTLEIARPF